VATLIYYGLHAFQHRGPESAGMAIADGHSLFAVKDMGLVSQVFDELPLAALQGHMAIGHTRYTTTGVPAGRAPSRRSRPTSPGAGSR
jgi:amidophosphoribosyltransferase